MAEAHRTKETVVPAKEPCPKCGSDDIYRRFFHKGQTVEHDRGAPYNKAAHPGLRVSPLSGYRSYAPKEVIVQHCRCCQYEWASTPLRKVKSA